MRVRPAVVFTFLVSTLAFAGCELAFWPTPTPTPTLEQLIAILQDPLSPDFWFAAEELAKMGPAAAPAAKALAKALRYPRRDSYMAAEALVAIGPAAVSVIPDLVQAIGDDLPRTRTNAAVVLAIIGPLAKCAAPDLARLLWDEDPEVRGAAAAALDAVTGIDLVPKVWEIDPSIASGVLDDPEGSVTEKARNWWVEKGQYLDWSDEPNLCTMSSP